MAFTSDKTRQGAAGAGAGGYTIDNSLRFEDGDNSYLSKTFGTPTSNTIWTFSCWLKRVSTGSAGIFAESTGYAGIYFNEYDILRVMKNDGSVAIATTGVYRDPSAWAHVVVRSNGTNIKAYWNSVEVGSYTGTITKLNANTTSHHLGRFSVTYFDGYLAEVNFIDGQALTPSDFGETGDYGEWKPIEYTGTYGTNGFYLDFADSGTGTASTTTVGADRSRITNPNHWASSGIASTDQMIDTPTNNFCTINPLAIASSVTLSEGNSRVVTGAYTNPILGSFLIPESGKWYWEVYVSSVGEMMTGIIDAGVATSTMYANKTGYYRSGGASNGYYIEGTVVSTAPASYTDGDIIRIAYNADDNQITWYKGTSSQGTENLTATKKPVIPYSVHGSSSGSSTFVANFGQDSSFAGTPTASLPTRPTGSPFNDGTYGEFFYEPPSGFLALCTANLPVPDVIPSEHFNTDVWAGDGGSSVSSTEVGFQPDFIWAKQRNVPQSHTLIDAVRGAGYIQGSDAAGSDYTATTYGQVTSFDENGFTATKGSNSSYSYFNHNGGTYVAWNWKAATNANTFNVLSGGSITSSSSNTTAGVTAGTLTTGWGVSANRDAGFSIVKYTGNGVDNSTIGHGLNSAPEMIIIKKRSQGDGWNTYHKDLTSGHEIFLNTTAASISDNSQASWGDTHPSSVGASTYAIGYAGDTNADTETFIAYCFHSVDGYSKVGSYTGNGVADGPFVYTGFRPAYVMTKSTSTGYWITHDTSRAPSNSSDKELFPNDSLGEYDGNRYLDVLSNGFKLRHSDSTQNTTGQTYIYIAFAETPFKYANAR